MEVVMGLEVWYHKNYFQEPCHSPLCFLSPLFFAPGHRLLLRRAKTRLRFGAVNCASEDARPTLLWMNEIHLVPHLVAPSHPVP